MDNEINAGRTDKRKRGNQRMDDYLVKKLYDVYQVPIAVYDSRCEELLRVPDGSDALPFEADESLLREFFAARNENNGSPLIYLETEEVYYSVFSFRDDLTAVIGPMSRITLSQKDIQSYARLHQLHAELPLPKTGLNKASYEAVLAYYLLSGNRTDPEDVRIMAKGGLNQDWDIKGELEQYQLEQSELNYDYHGIEYEQQLLHMVKTGDVDGIRREITVTNNFDHDLLGKSMGRENKRMEYLIVSYISHMARAAIDGGLSTVQAIERNEFYMQKMETATGFAQLTALANRAVLDFAQQVRKAQQEKSRYFYIEECKIFIAKNLHKPIKVGDIAPAIGVNRSYLAKRFSEAEGITIQAYIMRERCSHAANLLRCSDYSLSQIAEYFCFSSQSHFGRQFRKFFNMTPNEYRKQNHIVMGTWTN